MIDGDDDGVADDADDEKAEQDANFGPGETVTNARLAAHVERAHLPRGTEGR